MKFQIAKTAMEVRLLEKKLVKTTKRNSPL